MLIHKWFLGFCICFFFFHTACPMFDCFSSCSDCDKSKEKKNGVAMAFASGRKTAPLTWSSAKQFINKNKQTISYLAVIQGDDAVQEGFYLPGNIFLSLINGVEPELFGAKKIDKNLFNTIFSVVDTTLLNHKIGQKEYELEEKTESCGEGEQEKVTYGPAGAFVVSRGNDIYISWRGKARVLCSFFEGGYWTSDLSSDLQKIEYALVKRKKIRFSVVASSLFWTCLTPKIVETCVAGLLGSIQKSGSDIGDSAASIIAKKLVEAAEIAGCSTAAVGVMLF